MLINPTDLRKMYEADISKLKFIVESRKSAPENFMINTEHFSSLATLYPYIYHKALIKKHMKDSNAKILDWGAYLGQITYLLQDDYNVDSYNPKLDENIEYWNKVFQIKNPIFGKGLENGALNLESDSYDAAISSGVLEHTFEFGVSDVDALKNLYKVIKPNGLLFIWNLPTKYALTELLAEKKKKWKHILRYGLNDLLVKLNLSGFDIVEIERNEFIFNKLTKLFPNKDLNELWKTDYKMAQFPIFHQLAHHFTVVARKVPDFPNNPAPSGYVTYD